MNGRLWIDKQAFSVMQGVAFALGLSSPDAEFFEAVTGSLEEAILKKKQFEALRNKVSDG